MKKLSKYLLTVVFISLIFQCCTEPKESYKYYQIKNETGTDVLIKFYYSVKTSVKQYDSFNLKNNESSVEFYSQTNGIGSHSYFIDFSDSIDIYSNEILLKRYISPYIDNQAFSNKSLYNDLDYNTIVKSEKGYDVNVYRILKSDFE